MTETLTSRRVLLVIPARQGSRRLPGKNLCQLGGLPLVARAVLLARQAAVRLDCGSDVVASTDDAAIAATARQYGAQVPFMRPARLAHDDASSASTLRHAVEQMTARDRTYTSVVLLQCCSPFGNVDDILRAIALHDEHRSGSVVTVCPGKTEDRHLFCWDDGRLMEASATTPADNRVRLTGAVYVCSPQWLANHDVMSAPGLSRGVRVAAQRGLDIDTAADLAVAEQHWRDHILWPPDRCTVIAEAGVNHNGKPRLARALVDAAVKAGADAIKFQCFSPDSLVTESMPKAAYQARVTGGAESQRVMLEQLALPASTFRMLRDYCVERGIAFLASPFGMKEVDQLTALDVLALKIASGEITNHPLLMHAAATGRPILLSTGASEMSEVIEAVAALRQAGCVDLAMLHCVSSYPADPGDANLLAMATLRERFNVPIGFSDHTPGIAVAIAAAGLGARVVEKHLTLDRGLPGPDHASSLEPDAFSDMVDGIRQAWAARGDGVKRSTRSEDDVRRSARRSLVAIRDLPIGTVLQAADLVAKRAGGGISPADLSRVCGRRILAPVSCDHALHWTQVQQTEPQPTGSHA